MATKPTFTSTSTSTSSDTPTDPPTDPPTDNPHENLVEPIVGTGGELYGRASTTPDDSVINYPKDQDGVVVSAATSAQIAPDDPNASTPTDLSPGANA